MKKENKHLLGHLMEKYQPLNSGELEQLNKLALNGVDHTARPTWKLRETVEFYRDRLGLDLVHAIAAKGWGDETHPDFLHFFFDSGKGSKIAFFYYLGDDQGQPDKFKADMHHFFTATHTAWAVDTLDELNAWKERIRNAGVQVTEIMKHEVLESIYCIDPNGYLFEITLMDRQPEPIDMRDANLSIEAAMQLEDELKENEFVNNIEQVWQRKAKLVAAL